VRVSATSLTLTRGLAAGVVLRAPQPRKRFSLGTHLTYSRPYPCPAHPDDHLVWRDRCWQEAKLERRRVPVDDALGLYVRGRRDGRSRSGRSGKSRSGRNHLRMVKQGLRALPQIVARSPTSTRVRRVGFSRARSKPPRTMVGSRWPSSIATSRAWEPPSARSCFSANTRSPRKSAIAASTKCAMAR